MTEGLTPLPPSLSYKLDKVEDALSVNDSLWVKVLEISREEKDGRTHVKVRLSMKDAAQDGSEVDLSRDRAFGEAIKEQLAQSLNSAIGMGVALDPMAPKWSCNLILKSDGTKQSSLINGYALVGDDEGEVQAPKTATRIQPVGRGRGSTLPAWMTRSSGPTGMYDEEMERKKRKDKKREGKEQSKQRKLERKRHREEQRQYRKRRRRSSNSDGDGNDRRRQRRPKAAHMDGSEGDDLSDSGGDDSCRRRRSDVKYDLKRNEDKAHCKDPSFENVEEAKKLIARLERGKQRV